MAVLSLTAHPLKALFILFSLTLNTFRLPLWCLKYSLGSFARQHPKYTFKQALLVRIVRAYLYTISVAQVRVPLTLQAGPEGRRFVVLRARKEDGAKFRGVLEDEGRVKPEDVGATWYPAVLSPSSFSSAPGNEKEEPLLVLHIHGGAYVTGDGRTQATGFFAKTLLKNTPATHVLCPQYRLSSLSPAANAFPAALQDALTAYLHALTLVPAHRIILSGDSAGANCAIALLRYISEYGTKVGLPSPRAALLWSPWVDPTDVAGDLLVGNPSRGSDFIEKEFVAWGARALAGEEGSVRWMRTTRLVGERYVNVGIEGFRSEVPMWASIGSAEVLAGEGRRWRNLMRGVEGNEVELDVQEGACHDLLLVAELTGFEKEAGEIGARCGEWLSKVLERKDRKRLRADTPNEK